MSDLELIDAVAHVTGEDSHEIRRRGFMLTGPEDSSPEPECLLDVLLVDLPEMGNGRLGGCPRRRWLPVAVLDASAAGPSRGQGQREGRYHEAGGPSGVTCCWL
jgi:hypothetical protein